MQLSLLLEGAPMKRCTKCGEWKPATPDHWYVDNRRKSGFLPCCKVCQRAYDAAWRAANPEKQRAYNAAWYAANPEKKRAQTQRRRALKNMLPTLWDGDMEQAMLDWWGHTCAYCGKPIEGDMHLDHYIPLARKSLCPGTVRWNLLPACGPCNLSKRAAMPERWIRRTFGAGAEAILARIHAYFESVQPTKVEKRRAQRAPVQKALIE